MTIKIIFFINIFFIANNINSVFYKHLPNELNYLILEKFIDNKISKLISNNNISLLFKLAKSLFKIKLVNKKLKKIVDDYIKNHLKKKLLSFNFNINDNLNHLNLSLILNANSKKDHISLFKFFIDAGLDINLKNYYGENILIQAIRYNKVKLAKFLLNYKSDNIDKSQALIQAVKTGNIKLIKFILKSKVNIDERDNNGDTSLIVAVKNNPIDIKVLKLLIKHGANINNKNYKDNCVLTYAVRNQSINNTIINLLIKNGANVNSIDHYGTSVLKLATYNKNIELIKLLKKFGAKEYLSWQSSL